MENSINKIKNFISIVLYVKNDEKFIKKFINNIDTVMKNNFYNYEFVIVNNFSQDNTINIIKEIKNNVVGKITIINLAWEHSKDACMMAGCNMAIGDFILEFETSFIDYSNDEILNVYNLCVKGNDVVLSAPKNKMRISEKIFYKLIKYGSNINMSFTNEQFRIISRRAINRIYSGNNSNIYRKVNYYYSGFNTAMYYYNPTIEDKYKEKLEFSTLISTLLQYTNIYLALIYIYLFFMVGYYFFNNLNIDIFIGSSTLVILIMLGLVIKYIKFINNKNISKNPYVYKSIDRL